MANTDSGNSYYIRVRGRVLGPYDISQLKTLRGRGQFSRANEVSTDRQTWQSAASIEQLLGATPKPSGWEPPPDEPTLARDVLPAGGNSIPPSRPTVQPIWHYAVGTEQYGPVTLVELRGLVSSGQLSIDDFVWKEGLPDWIRVDDVAELTAVTKSNVAPAPQTAINVSAGHFCFACGSPADARAEVCPRCGVRQHGSGNKKDRLTAALLAFFLGGLGVHHFYLGNTLLGVIYLLFCWTFVPVIISFVEFIVLLCMSDSRFAAKYEKRQ